MADLFCIFFDDKLHGKLKIELHQPPQKASERWCCCPVSSSFSTSGTHYVTFVNTLVIINEWGQYYDYDKLNVSVVICDTDILWRSEAF
jgi:hypothetical protein